MKMNEAMQMKLFLFGWIVIFGVAIWDEFFGGGE